MKFIRKQTLLFLSLFAACYLNTGCTSTPSARDAALDITLSDSLPVDGHLPKDVSSSVDAEVLDETQRALRELSPVTLPAPPVDITNQFADDTNAALLGQKLFFDPLFSGALLDGDNDGTPETLGHVGDVGKVACVGCHIPDAGFLDNRTLGKQISLAAGWVIRRTPSLLDVGQTKLLMWDGSKDTLYNQVFGPLESRDEMNTSRLYVAQQLFARYKNDYEAIFGALPPLNDTSRFPMLTDQTTGCRKIALNQYKCRGMPGDNAEYDGMSNADKEAVTRVVVNVGKAIGAYQRRLSCGPSRFDQWVHGDETALTPSEQRGAKLFVGKGKCNQCHAGPYFSDHQFHNVGLMAKTVAVVFIDAGDMGASVGLQKSIDNPLNSQSPFSDGDDGRLPQTVPTDMEGAFRTPMLRCVSMRPSFMHTGHMRTLEEVVAFFNRGGDIGGYPGTNELKPLELSSEEQTDLVVFLKALEGPGPDKALLTSP